MVLLEVLLPVCAARMHRRLQACGCHECPCVYSAIFLAQSWQLLARCSSTVQFLRAPPQRKLASVRQLHTHTALRHSLAAAVYAHSFGRVVGGQICDAATEAKPTLQALLVGPAFALLRNLVLALFAATPLRAAALAWSPPGMGDVCVGTRTSMDMWGSRALCSACGGMV